MHMKWIFEDNAPKLMRALSILSAIAGIVTLIDSLLKTFGTSILQFLAGMLGITIQESFGIPAWLTLLLLLVSSGYLLWSTKRSENRREGIAQLADASCINTLRLVTLVHELRRRPERATNALDTSGLRGIPVDSAIFSFRMANVNSCKGEVVRNPLTECPLDEDRVVRVDDKKFISSDVEYNFEFKLPWYTRFWSSIPLVSWLFGDNGKRPEHFRYYYAHRSAKNEHSTSPAPYKNSSFSYTPNEGLYVVSHPVCPSSVGPDRIFGMSYHKRGCLVWDFDDDFTIYPTAIVGDVRRATFRVELQKGIYDILKSSGGVNYELHEFICSGKDPGKGGRPAYFEYAGTVQTKTRSDDGVQLSNTDPERLFCCGREYVVFETPEVKINPKNVYVVLVKPDPDALDELRAQASSFVNALNDGEEVTE